MGLPVHERRYAPRVVGTSRPTQSGPVVKPAAGIDALEAIKESNTIKEYPVENVVPGDARIPGSPVSQVPNVTGTEVYTLVPGPERISV